VGSPPQASDSHSERIKELEAEVRHLSDANEKIASAAMSGDRERENQARIDDYKHKAEMMTDAARAEQQEKAMLMRTLADEQNLREEVSSSSEQ
jgi:hypothetical protein